MTKTKSKAVHETQKATESISSFIGILKRTTESLTSHLIDKRSDQSFPVSLLKQKPATITGLGLIFFDNQEKPNGHYFVEQQDTQTLHKLFDIEAEEWYQQAIKNDKSFFGPVLDPVTKQKIIIYTEFFYTHENHPTPAGIVFATQSIEHIHHILSTLYTGLDNYWFVTDKEGYFFMRPLHRFVHKGQSKEISDTQIKRLITDMHQHALNTHVSIELTNNQQSWLCAAPIPLTDLILFSVFDVYEPFNNHEQIKKELIFLLLSLISMILALLLLYAFYKQQSVRTLWLCSLISSATLIAGIGFFWHITLLYLPFNVSNLMVKGKKNLYQFLDSLSDHPSNTHLDDSYYLNYRYKNNLYVPTGILVQDLNFISKDQVEFVGIIWQRYFSTIHDGISRGFILDLLTSRPSIKEISRIKTGNEETYIWLVHAKLNQSINYYKFPFDSKDIRIQISPIDFDKNITLVPDLDSYTLLNPTTLPGVSTKAHLSGWQLYASYFGYDFTDYNSSFGIYRYGPFGITQKIDKSHVPELQLVIHAKRNLLDTLTTDLIALVVIALLLFLLLMTYKDQNIADALTTFATILFSTIVAQQYFKSKIPADEFVYFELFYFIMFIAILTVIFLTFFDSLDEKRNGEYRKYISIAALLYWPILLTALFVSTIFYLF